MNPIWPEQLWAVWLWALGAALAAAAAYLALFDPGVFGLVFLPLAVLAGLAATRRWPTAALRVAILVVLVAGTKVRARDPLASVSGIVDAQVVVELALYVLVAIVLVLVRLTTVVPPSRRTPSHYALIAFVGIAMASVLWSEAPLLTAVRSIQLAVLVALAITLIDRVGPGPSLAALGGATTIYILVCSTLAVSTPWAASSIQGPNDPWRFSWFAVHPIPAGTYCALAILLLVALQASYRKRGPRNGRLVPWRYAALLAIPPLLTVLVFTKARGPLLALVIASLAWTARRFLRRWQVPALAAAALFLAATVSPAAVARVLTHLSRSGGFAADVLLRGQSASEVAGLSGRSALWRDLVPMFIERPLLGYGYQGSRPFILDAMPWAGYAHNAFAQVLLDLGIVGAVPLFFAIGRIVRATLPRRRDDALGEHWASGLVFTLSTFLIVSGMTDESFAGQTGFETLVLMIVVLAGERVCQAATAARIRMPPVKSARSLPPAALLGDASHRRPTRA